MTSLVHPNAVAPAAERHTFTIVAVGALHVAVIYAIMVALNIAPSPTKFSPFEGRVIQIVKPVVDTFPPVKPSHQTNFSKPDNPVVVQPVIDIDHEPTGGQIHGGTGTGAQGDVVVAASAVAGTHNIPSYPSLDRRLGHEGTVMLALWIGVDGTISQATVVHSSGYDGLDQAAVDWVKAHWRYKPAMKNGVAVPSSLNAAVTFRLTQG